jgi:hypothetical protein
MDILIDPLTWDAVFHNGPLTREYTTQPDSTKVTQTVAQRLKIRLLTFLGEWDYNTAYGVPYFQSILGKKISKNSVDMIFQQKILEEAGVQEIVNFSSTLNNRKYTLSFQIKVNGLTSDVITLEPI